MTYFFIIILFSCSNNPGIESPKNETVDTIPKVHEPKTEDTIPNGKIIKYICSNGSPIDCSSITSNDDLIKTLKNNKKYFQNSLKLNEAQLEVLIGIFEFPKKYPIYDFETKKSVLNKLPKDSNIKKLIFSEWYDNLDSEYKTKFYDDLKKSKESIK
jgi:hypothetical protein